MTQKKHPHLFLDEFIKHIPPITDAYFHPKGGERSKAPQLDYQAHGAKLLADLASVFRQNEEINANQDFAAVTLRFVSQNNVDLALESLESPSRGIHLLNVRKNQAEETTQQTATVLVPRDKQDYFAKKIQPYADGQTTSKGKIKARDLCDKILRIELPKLEDFWIDAPDELDVAPNKKSWRQVWVQREQSSNKATSNLVQSFRNICNSLSLDCRNSVSCFKESLIFLVYGSKNNFSELLLAFPYITAFCPHYPLVTQWYDAPISEQKDWIEDLQNRTLISTTKSEVAVCLLDTGVVYHHPLLQNVVSESNCYTTFQDGRTFDSAAHGTEMMGLLVYGDLAQLFGSSDYVTIQNHFESVRIVSSSYSNPPELYGSITSQAIYRVESQEPTHSRIICMAVTSEPIKQDGTPDEWSSVIDALAFGEQSVEYQDENLLFTRNNMEKTACQSIDNGKRLFVLSAGNIQNEDEILRYPTSNETSSIESPAQAWNALTIGAYTQKGYLEDKTAVYDNILAPLGGLSPASRTALLWHSQWPIKPDLVCEGGNRLVYRNEQGDIHAVDSHYDLEILTLGCPSWQNENNNFSTMSDTSAATALAARMTMLFKTQYPQAWPETVRAALINSADWTPTMLSQYTDPHHPKKEHYKNLTRVYGYGVPSLPRVLESFNSSLTMVIQDEIVPYRYRKSNLQYGDVKFYTLPWPQDELRMLANQPVRLRVALSYFISPNPTFKSFHPKYKYQSHSLGFKVKTPNLNLEEFKKTLCSSENELKVEDNNWLLGIKNRQKGSLCADIWEGTAIDLASRNVIAVYPNASGWWKTTPERKSQENRARFSLVVTLELPKIDIDIWNVINQDIEMKIRQKVTI